VLKFKIENDSKIYSGTNAVHNQKKPDGNKNTICCFSETYRCEQRNYRLDFAQFIQVNSKSFLSLTNFRNACLFKMDLN
jgi:hypothetical protein